MGRIKKGAALALCLFLLVGAAAGAVAADGEKEAANIIESDCFAPIGPGLESGEEGLDNLTSLEIGEITGQLTAQLGINFFILAYEKSPLDGQTLEDYITGYENAQKSRGEEFKNTILLFACVDEDLSVGQRFFLRLYGEAQGMLDGEEAEKIRQYAVGSLSGFAGGLVEGVKYMALSLVGAGEKQPEGILAAISDEASGGEAYFAYPPGSIAVDAEDAPGVWDDGGLISCGSIHKARALAYGLFLDTDIALRITVDGSLTEETIAQAESGGAGQSNLVDIRFNPETGKGGVALGDRAYNLLWENQENIKNILAEEEKDVSQRVFEVAVSVVQTVYDRGDFYSGSTPAVVSRAIGKMAAVTDSEAREALWLVIPLVVVIVFAVVLYRTNRKRKNRLEIKKK